MTCGAHGCVLWQPLCPMLGQWGVHCAKTNSRFPSKNVLCLHGALMFAAKKICVAMLPLKFWGLPPPHLGQNGCHSTHPWACHKSCNMQSIAIARCGHDPSPAHRPLGWTSLGVLCQQCTFFVFLAWPKHCGIFGGSCGYNCDNIWWFGQRSGKTKKNITLACEWG